MAKSKISSPNNEATTENDEVFHDSDNEKWEDVSISGPQQWHARLPGNTVRGMLVSRDYRAKSRNAEEKYFYRIEIDSPTRVMFKDSLDEKAKERIAQPGTIVCVDETKDLEDLAVLCMDGGKYLVKLTPTEKIRIGKNSFWRWEKKKVCKRQPTKTVDPKSIVRASKTDDSDVPF